MPTSPTPAVSLVVVSWRSRDEVVACVESIAEHPPSVPWEVVVVDNASGDGTVEALAGRSGVRVIANATNRGLSAANNQGIDASRGGVLIISNPDVEYTKGSIDALLGCLQRHPRAAFAFARLVHPDGTLQTSAGDLPTFRDALRGRQLVRRAARAGARTGFWWDGWAHDVECQIGHGLEASYAVRREAIADIGPQDERFPLDWEGIDWCATAQHAGWEVWFCPDAEVTHRGGVSIRQAELRWVIRSHRGMYRYFAKRASPPARLPLALVVALRAAIKAAAVLAGARLYSRAHP